MLVPLVLEDSEARRRPPDNRVPCGGRSGRAAPRGAESPSYSIGFSVASRRNGDEAHGLPRRPSPAARLTSPSRKSRLVFGVARLISSTRTAFAKIGPGRNSKSRDFWSKMDSPVTSVGCRSGCTGSGRAAPSTLPAIARASTVFAVPGTSSRRTWPPQMSAVGTSLIVPLAVDDGLDVGDETVGDLARAKSCASSLRTQDPSPRAGWWPCGRFQVRDRHRAWLLRGARALVRER